MGRPPLHIDLAVSLDDAPVPPTPTPPSTLDLSKCPPVERLLAKKIFPFDRAHKDRSPSPFSPTERDHPVLAAYLRRGHGGAVELARKLKCSASIVSLWANSRRPIPIGRCYQIEDATKGQLTCEMLRPDIRWKRQHYGKIIEHTPTDYVPPPQPFNKRVLEQKYSTPGMPRKDGTSKRRGGYNGDSQN